MKKRVKGGHFETEKNRPGGRFPGSGKALDSPAQDRDYTHGRQELGSPNAPGDKQAAKNKPTSVDWDKGYGNVSGSYSKPVVMGGE